MTVPAMRDSQPAPFMARSARHEPKVLAVAASDPSLTLPARGARKCMRRGDGYHDDDHDDLDIAQRTRSNQNPTHAGMFGFIAAMVSLGMLGVVLVLFILLEHEEQVLDRTRLLYYWFLLLDVLSFFAGLTATILGARGTSPTNPLFRGYATAALILGIIEMAVTMLLSLIIMCCGMLPLAINAGG